MARGDAIPIERLEVSAFKVPTDRPESDGTLEWDSTTCVVVEAVAGGRTGIGYAYTSAAAAMVVKEKLEDEVRGRDATDVPGAFEAMVRSVRNMGSRGITASAISAVDAALWDLKARLLDVALVTLLGAVRERVAVYGSGGFTSYTLHELCAQLGGWVASGMGMVKMKVGRDPGADPMRVEAARDAIGTSAELFVDANGGYERKQALLMAQMFAQHDVRWFEEPVTSDDLEGLRLLRDQGPPGMAVAAGEYGYDPYYFRRMLEAGAVDVLQADATRCRGITGFLQVGALCEAYGMRLSAHTAPSIHAHVACALPAVVHVEYFHDHVRLEGMLFEGAARAQNGALTPDRTRPGLGIELKRKDAERFAV
jgi:L-alanine-DL-glutamate epimerase-like enolase superfamily enzyme